MMKENEYICPKCGNKKYFYVEVVIPGRIRFNPKTEECYGKVYNIDKGQYDEFALIYCRDCEEIVYQPPFE